MSVKEIGNPNPRFKEKEIEPSFKVKTETVVTCEKFLNSKMGRKSK